MPCRDKSATLLVNPWEIGLLQPFHLCRVPAQVCHPIMNPLILLTKFGESLMFNPGTGPIHLGTGVTASANHACPDWVESGGTWQWPGTHTGFYLLTGTRPPLFGDFRPFLGSFWGLKLTRKRGFLPCFEKFQAHQHRLESLCYQCFSWFWAFLFSPCSQVALGNENECQAQLGINRGRSQAQLGNEKRNLIPP